MLGWSVQSTGWIEDAVFEQCHCPASLARSYAEINFDATTTVERMF